MTPAARLSAAIEILDAVIAAARGEGAAADTLIARYFRDRRYAGAKDRRAVRDLVYDVIRHSRARPDNGRVAMVAYAQQVPELLALFGGGGHAPEPLVAGETDKAYAEDQARSRWLTGRFHVRFEGETNTELAALMTRAPLDLRANRIKTTREALAPELPPTMPIAAPDGLRAVEPFAVESHPAFLDGRLEVQDGGSQLACEACEAAPGTTVIDLCAGAGGKTLSLAASMANEGRLIACDTDRNRLDRLTPRAERAGATIIERRLLDPRREDEALADLAGTADLLLIDAPCSGTGTWRRNPEARWRLTPERLRRLTTLQARLLDVARPLVAPGGRLVYVVCSLLVEEGDAQVDSFLGRTPGWRRVKEDRLLTPHRDGTDGFFIAVLSPIC